MRKMILFVVLIVFGMNVSAKEKKEWVYSDGKLDKVFEIATNSKSTELLRLYEDGTYEHLLFTSKSAGREEVERNLGTYQIKKSRITFSAPGEKDFSGKFRFGTFFYNGRLYQNLFDMKVRKNRELFRRTTDKKFFKPFFICLNSDEVVHNREAAEQLDLNRLIDYLLLGKRTDEEKVMSIIRLIVGSVEYDREGARTDRYTNQQNDAKSILAGRNRLAVCAGYSYTFKTLCDISGIKAQTVCGNTKQDFSDLTRLGGYHAWNIAEVEGEERLYDVTWADDGETLDMRWVDVDPLVMIGTHFPDNAEHQLLSKTITQDQFLFSPVITPLTESAAPVAINLPARQFAGKNFRMVLPGKHTIMASIFPADITEVVYGGESGAKTKSYTAKNVGSGHYDGDSTYFIVPLQEAINPLEINIDGQISVKSVVFKGGQTDLMKYFLSKANRQHIDAYMKGVIAAIRINDAEALKKLVGEDHAVFFDRKGKLKLDKKVQMACLDWTGDLSSLTKVHSTSISIGEDGEVVKHEENSMYIAIPGKLKFDVEFDGVFYSIKSVEAL